MKEVCEKDIKQLFCILLFLFRLLEFSSIDFCLEAEGGGNKKGCSGNELSRERMGREKY